MRHARSLAEEREFDVLSSFQPFGVAVFTVSLMWPSSTWSSRPTLRATLLAQLRPTHQKFTRFETRISSLLHLSRRGKGPSFHGFIQAFWIPLSGRVLPGRVHERVNRRLDVTGGAMAAARRLLSPRVGHLGGTLACSTVASRSFRANGSRGDGEERPTELIFKLERRGEGWAEEILPSLTIERRDVPRKKSSARKEAQRREEGAAERFVCLHGVPEEQAVSVVDRACAWRVTRGGRALIDRRRRKRVQRHMEKVVKYLEDVCGVEPGEEGVAKVIQATPQILGCNVSLNDRWERRVVELAAYMADHGGNSDVPQGWEPNPELGNWVGKQRAAKQQGTLSEEREEMLISMGFTFDKFHETSVCWEERFDFLLDFKLSHGHCLVPRDWVLEDGCELGAWVEEQRRLFREGLLTEGMISRLEHIGFVWEVPASDTWIEQYSELIKHKYDPERQRLGIQPRLVNRNLSKWVEEQLLLWRKGSLKPELQSLLEDAGLSLDSGC